MILTDVIDGKGGEHTFTLYDAEGTAQSLQGRLAEARLTYEAKGRTDMQGELIPSRLEVTIVADANSTFQDVLDDAEEGRFYATVTGPRGDGSNYSWTGVLMPREVSYTMAPVVFKRDAINLVFTCGLNLMKERDAQFTSRDSIDRLMTLLRFAQDADTGFTHAKYTLPVYQALDPAGLLELTAARREEQADGDLEAQLDQYVKVFGWSLFQPTSEAGTFWGLPWNSTGTAPITQVELELNGDASLNPDTELRLADIEMWSERDRWGRSRAVRYVTLESDKMGNLVDFPTFDVFVSGEPLGWTRVSGTQATAVSGSNSTSGAILLDDSVYRQRLIKLPPVENCGVEIEIRQAHYAEDIVSDIQTGLLRAGVAYNPHINEGIQYYVWNGSAWVEGTPHLNPGAANDIPHAMLEFPVDGTATARTGALPVLEHGGDLYLYLYGGEDSVFNSIVYQAQAKLFDTVTNEQITTLRTAIDQTATKGEDVTLPLFTDWTSDIGAGTMPVDNFYSAATETSYGTFAEAVAADRIANQTRKRRADVDIEGLWSPEFRLTLKDGGHSPFGEDVEVRLNYAEWDFHTGRTQAEVIEVGVLAPPPVPPDPEPEYKTLYFRDELIDAPSTYLENHTPDVPVGSNVWVTSASSTVEIIPSAAFSRIEFQTTSTTLATYDVEQSDGIILARCTVNISDIAGVVFRYSDSSNFWMARVRNADSELQLYKNVAGSFSKEASVAVTDSLGEYQMAITLNGTSISVAIHGLSYPNTPGATASTTDSFNQAETIIGFRASGTASEPDDCFTRIQMESL